MITEEEIKELLEKAPENEPHVFISKMSYQLGVIDTYERVLREFKLTKEKRSDK